MSQNVTINGTVYAFPETGDSNWGDVVTNWAVSVSSGLLQKSGGSFILTDDINFGPTFGVLSKYFSDFSNTPLSSTGVVRLKGNTIDSSVAWRNVADTDDLKLYTDSSDNLFYRKNGSDFNLISGGGTGIVGPVSSTDTAFVRYSGTDGTVVQDSQTTEDASGNVIIASDLNVINSLDVSVDLTVDATSNLTDVDLSGEIDLSGAGSITANFADTLMEATTRGLHTTTLASAVGDVVAVDISPDFTTQLTSPQLIESITITVSGNRPVFVGLMPQTASLAFVEMQALSTTEAEGKIKISAVGSSSRDVFEVLFRSGSTGSVTRNTLPTFHNIDPGGPDGSNEITFNLYGHVSAGATGELRVTAMRLVAYEL